MKNNKGGKLSLNKETIAKLNDSQMNSIQGGAPTQTKKTCLTQTQGCGCNGITRTDYCWNLTLDLQNTDCY